MSLCFIQQRILWAEAPSLRIRKVRKCKHKEKHTDKREERWGEAGGKYWQKTERKTMVDGEAKEKS